MNISTAFISNISTIYFLYIKNLKEDLMKFVCDGLSLAEAVVKTSKACAVRTTAPVMECIKLSAQGDGVTLLATDGELSIRKTIGAEVLEEGETCVPGKLFSDFLSKLTDVELTVSTGPRGMEIGYLDSVSYLQVLPAEEFPRIDLEIGENYFVMKQGALKKLIAETAFCCAQDDSRPILKGCLFEFKDRLEATALDGYRLAVSSAELLSKSGEKQVICPARTLNEISRSLTEDDKEITVYTQGGMLLVELADMTIVSRLYQGDFIRKESVIPPSFTTTVTLPRLDLIGSVERAAILIRGDKNNLVTLEIGGETVKINSSSESGNVSEVVRAYIEGRDLVISMKAKYLLDGLRALDEEEAILSFNGPVSPFILQNKGKKESLYLILPVRNAQ